MAQGVPLVIGGEEIQAQNQFEVISPLTNSCAHKCTNATAEHANDAVNAAAKAFPSWSHTSPSQRRKVFLEAAEVLERRSEELVNYMVIETGSDQAWAAFNIVLAKGTLLDCAGKIMSLQGSIPTVEDVTASAMVVKEPYGVVVGIAPWSVKLATEGIFPSGTPAYGLHIFCRNAPYALGFRAVTAAIAAGNACVLKGSELSPRSFWAVASVFKEAGLPDGVLNFISCDSSNASIVTTALVAHGSVKKLNFTGSTPVGRIIAEMAGKYLKPVLMELGGKAPAIVWEDADLDRAADHCALGSFMHAGQICMSTERIIVHKNIQSSFEEKLRASLQKFYSSQKDAPMLVQQRSVEKNMALLNDALAKGAKVVCGDFNTSEISSTRMRPVAINNVDPSMDIYKLESFGPSVSIIAVDTEEEALRIANDTEYGLSSSIFTGDLWRGLRMAKQIETGAVHINSMSVHDEAALPHGGAKDSGFGRFGGGLEEWVRTKNIIYRP